jgi:hypothetical protein
MIKDRYPFVVILKLSSDNRDYVGSWLFDRNISFIMGSKFETLMYDFVELDLSHIENSMQKISGDCVFRFKINTDALLFKLSCG